ncbi:Integrator complex subunit 7 [Dispira simplex]|nr:Integrator complex subunit 7 [Dispira simplex]
MALHPPARTMSLAVSGGSATHSEGWRNQYKPTDGYGEGKTTTTLASSESAFKKLLELEGAWRTNTLAPQVKAILGFEALFRLSPFPVVVNTAFLKLTDMFREGNNGLRYLILKTLSRLQTYMGPILNEAELARRLLLVVAMNDPLARVLALRAVGCFSSVFGERRDVQHAVVRRMGSKHTVEALAAIQAADKLCQHSASFPRIVWLTLVQLIDDLRTPRVTRYRLVYILRHMHNDPGLAERAHQLCLRWLHTDSLDEFVLYVMKTATHLASHTLIHVEELLTYLFTWHDARGSQSSGNNHPAVRVRQFRRESLQCIAQLLTRTLVFEEQYLVKISQILADVYQQGKVDLIRLGLMALEHLLNRADVPLDLPTTNADVLLHCYQCVVPLIEHDDIRISHAAAKVVPLLFPLVSAVVCSTVENVPESVQSSVSLRLTQLVRRSLQSGTMDFSQPLKIRLLMSYLTGVLQVDRQPLDECLRALFSLYPSCSSPRVLSHLDRYVFCMSRQCDVLAIYAQEAQRWLKNHQMQPSTFAFAGQLFSHAFMGITYKSDQSTEDGLSLATLRTQFGEFLAELPPTGKAYNAVNDILPRLGQLGDWTSIGIALEFFEQPMGRMPPLFSLWFTLMQDLTRLECHLAAESSNGADPGGVIGQLLEYQLRVEDVIESLLAIKSLGFDRRFQVWFLRIHLKVKELYSHLLSLVNNNGAEAIPYDHEAAWLRQVTLELDGWCRCATACAPTLDPFAAALFQGYRFTANVLLYHLHRLYPDSSEPHTLNGIKWYWFREDTETSQAMSLDGPTTGDQEDVIMPSMRSLLPPRNLIHACQGTLLSESSPNILDYSSLVPRLVELVCVPLCLPRQWFSNPDWYNIRLDTFPQHSASDPPLVAYQDELFVLKLDGIIQATTSLSENATKRDQSPFVSVRVLSFLSTQSELDTDDLPLMSEIHQVLQQHDVTRLPTATGALNIPQCLTLPLVNGFFRGDLVVTLPSRAITRQVLDSQTLYIHVYCAPLRSADQCLWLPRTRLTLPLRIESRSAISSGKAEVVVASQPLRNGSGQYQIL